MSKTTFPDRIVLSTGFPWAMGLGKADDPYNKVAMSKIRIGFQPETMMFPSELWSRKVPRYRLVLERVRPTRRKKAVGTIAQPAASLPTRIQPVGLQGANT